MKFEFSKHAKAMIKERNITEEWVWNALLAPMYKDFRPDNNIHYFKSIPKQDGKVLHVVVTPNTKPPKFVTAFFDRRRKK